MNELEAIIREQTEREDSHRATTQAASWAALSLALEKGDIDKVPVARAVLKRTFEPLRDELRALLADKATRAPALLWYRKVGVDVVAVLFLRELSRSTLLGNPSTLQRTCVKLGRAIMEEARVLDAESVNPLYMQRTEEYLRSKNVSSESHTARTMMQAASVVLHEDYHVEASEAVQVGKWALDAAMRCGIVEQRKVWVKNETLITYHFVHELEELLTRTPYCDSLTGVELLMIAPPRLWTPGAVGGYLLPTKNPLGNKHHPADRKASRQALETCTPLMHALNALQSTPLRIEQRGLSIVRAIWTGSQGGALGIPSVHPLPEPAFPFPEGWLKSQASEGDMERFREWSMRKADWYTEERRRKADVKRLGIQLKEGAALAERPVYAPTFADWRTRVYYRGTPNPQGPDYSKACIRFDERKPLGERGLFWLKVHIANSFGQDKGRMAERARWVDQNLDTLQNGMYRPQDADAYRELADYPVLAAVAVQELTGALEANRPEEYLSGLPIHMDATCSGLQHFSALLRDPEGGRYVNLLDDGQPQKMDIYQRVLDVQLRQLADAVRSPDRVLAELWLQAGLNRDSAKGPTMTYVYGATQRGTSDHYRKWLLAQGWEVPGVSVFKMGDFLAKLTFEALETSVPAAAACMHWVRQCARATDKGGPFRWESPIGALIQQTYRDAKRVRVNIRRCGVKWAVVLQDLERMRSQKMQAGSAPNFVHSLDAAHLVRCVNRMVEHGASMVTIHDSFGCHAADVDLMHRVIREEFVSMYEEHDPLGKIVELNNLDMDVPRKGTLDLSRVLGSEFFFC